MKRLLILIAAVLFLVACGDTKDVEKESTTSEDSEVTEQEAGEVEKQEEEVENVEEDTSNLHELDTELQFAELVINVESVETYEEDGKDYAELRFNWTNQSGEGKKYFFSLVTHGASQNGEPLEEVTGASDIANKKTNSYHEHNGEGGTVNIKLVYELEDTETPVVFNFSPLNEYDEESQQITIEF